MTKVSRNDIFIRDENGPEWFEEFLRSLAGQKQSSLQDILDSINNQRSKTIESVVQSYREQVGLDALAKDDDNTTTTVKKSEASRRLSIRHAINEEQTNIIEKIKSDPDIQAAVDSMLQHSGGNKKTHAIIDFLRDKLGADLVSYTDDALNEYIEEKRKNFKSIEEKENPSHVGLVGLEDEYDDDVADYILHDGAK
jgi:hypothetical protein